MEHQSPNFYRRVLPSSCISFSSKEGRQIFQSSLINKGLKAFYCLIEQHSTQSEPAYCGPSTLVIVLNALAVDPRRKWKGPWRWYDEHMLNCCIDLEEVKTTGITLSTFICLARCQGVSVQGQYASECTIDRFRDAIRQSCIEEADDADIQHKFLVVSYNRSVLSQTGAGHFSPVAAYDPQSDSVLILDTARFKYGAHWVSVPLLFESMQKIDPDTNKSRGFVLLSTKDSMDLLESILFRTKQSHKDLWQKYEDYLNSLSNDSNYTPTLDEVYSYWTQNGQNLLYASALLIPQYLPIDLEVQKQVKNIVTILSKLIQNHPKLVSLHAHELEQRCETFQTNEIKCSTNPDKSCGGDSTSIPIGCAESIFIIYLASFKDEKDRLDIIKSYIGEDEAKYACQYPLRQILAEAELIKLAMSVNHLFEK